MTETRAGEKGPFPGWQRFTNEQLPHVLNAVARADANFQRLVFEGMVSPTAPQLAIEDGNTVEAGRLVRSTRAILGRQVAYVTASVMGTTILWEDVAIMLGRGNVAFTDIPSMVLDALERRDHPEQQEQAIKNRVSRGEATTSDVKHLLQAAPGNKDLVAIRRRQKQEARIANVATIQAKLDTAGDNLTLRQRVRLEALKRHLERSIPAPEES